MTSNIKPETGVVEFGPSDESSGSPNNTIIEIASSAYANIDQNILIELNLHLLSVSIVRENTVLNLDANGSVGKKFKVPNEYSDTYRLRNIATSQGISSIDLISLNRDTLAKHSCFDAGNTYVTAVGSLTKNKDL